MKHVNPFAVAIWCGETKPAVLNDYLTDFVSEM